MKLLSLRRHVSVLIMMLPVSATVAWAAVTSTPLSYSTTFTDPSGTPQSVSFTGTASGTSLSGTLTVNGAAEQVTAIIGSDGSVSGKLLNADGSQYGVFWGRPVARSPVTLPSGSRQSLSSRIAPSPTRLRERQAHDARNLGGPLTRTPRTFLISSTMLRSRIFSNQE